MKRIVVGLALWLSAAIPANAKEPGLDPKMAYVLVDIGDLEDSVMKGADLPGAVTLGRYDPVKQDI